MYAMNKLALVLVIVLISCKGKGTIDQEKEMTVQAPIESELDNILLSELDNKRIDLNQYRGKIIFINFWATWCKPCIQEMPSIQKAMALLNNKNIVYFFASDEDVAQIKKFKKNNSYTFHYVKADNMQTLGLMALPTTYIFNPEGKLVFSEMGFRKWDDKNNLDLIINAGK